MRKGWSSSCVPSLPARDARDWCKACCRSSLSSQEGVALMCLAEALLRIPDAATRDALIRDKLRGGDWQAHLGKSPSLFVNAAAWGLVVTGKLVDTHSEPGLLAALKRVTTRGASRWCARPWIWPCA